VQGLKTRGRTDDTQGRAEGVLCRPGDDDRDKQRLNQARAPSELSVGKLLG